ncbi:hypothetical protein N0V85_009403 [Neurospora sp. IMI 360204]|nr:hypothetical protein N0V85_009403 [Neurospora sp. IMI 360204]
MSGIPASKPQAGGPVGAGIPGTATRDPDPATDAMTGIVDDVPIHHRLGHKWALTILMILAPPAGDAFNFIIDLQVLPSAFFQLIMGISRYVVRYRRSRLNLPRPEFKAWDLVVVFNILVQLYLVVMPWYPPAGGAYAGDAMIIDEAIGLKKKYSLYIQAS